MDERWTSGRGDDQPSPPPDRQDPDSSPERRDAQPEGTSGTETPDNVSPETQDAKEASADAAATAGEQPAKGPASPYTIPGAEGTSASSSSSWTAALDDAWGATGSPVMGSWSEDPEPDHPAGEEQPGVTSGPASHREADQPSSPADGRADTPGGTSGTADAPAGHAFGGDQPTESWPVLPGELPDSAMPAEESSPRPWDDVEHNTPPVTDRPATEPTPSFWDHTVAPATGPFPHTFPDHESHEQGTTGHEAPADNTTSFATTWRQDDDPTHTARQEPPPSWDGGEFSGGTSTGAQPASAPPPMPRHGDVAWDAGPREGDAPREAEGSPLAASAGAPPEGPYQPGYSPTHEHPAKAASLQPSGPQEPLPPLQDHSAPPGSDDESPRRSRKGLIIGITSAVVVLALIGGVTSWYLMTMPKPEETAEAYADAWSNGNYEAMAGLTTGDGDAEETLSQFADNLGVTESQIEMGEVSDEGDGATVSYEVTLSLKNAGDWSYEGELPLVRQDGEWFVDFSPTVMHPELDEGQTLTRVSSWGERGSILAADGTPLDTGDAGGSVSMMVGEVGTAEEEDLEDLGPAYQVGDPTGVSGLQKSYEERLAGEAGISIRLVNEGDEDQAAQQEDPTVIKSIEGTDGKDVTTSLDPAIQDAAAQAVSGESDPATVTAIRPSTGEILGVANIPGDLNRSFDGTYAPGSAFKVVTYQALLESGLGVDDTMSCPEEATVGGWPFTNAEDAEYGQQSVTEAFATSCNTALVQEVDERLDSETLTAAAERFGMNSDLDIGMPTTEPSFPAPENTTMLATQSIGQGQTQTTPLQMATVPAAVADGSWRSPTLVSEPEPDQPEPTQIANADQLGPMMREVVTNGTADGADFQGEVHGKTGSAEFGEAEGEDDELETHAWFIGYQEDVAFSVLVEGGGGGGDVAAPIGADFANAL